MKTVFLALLMAATLSAQGQVRKCTGPDGKITYSDFICGKDTANEAGVRTDYNTIDSSGSRLDAQRMKTDEAVKSAMQKDAGNCKFSYFALGDEKGKLLAAAAKQECLDNIRAKASGMPTSLEAYNFWKDHAAQKSTDRQASLNRAAAAQAQQNQSLTCKRGILGNELECRSR